MLLWIPSNKGYKGNVIVDKLIKPAAKEKHTDVKPMVEVTEVSRVKL